MTGIVWTQRQDIGPAARTNAAMAFDPERSHTVLFGGRDRTGALGDTWGWDGAHWTQLQDTGPSARDTAAMAAGDHVIVLFGGFQDSAVAGSFRAGDTWGWDGAYWTQIADTGPSPRNRASLVFDAAHGCHVLFGGAGDAGEYGDTWTFDGAQWTQVADSGPAARIGHAMAFDAARGLVVLFGGQSNGVADGETWTWDGDHWTQQQDAGPSPRAGHALAGDPGSVWLFGGAADLDSAGAADLRGDTWEWNGSTWTQRQDMGPSPRFQASIAFDTVRDRLVLFGGASVTDLDDTWEAQTSNGASTPSGVSDLFTIDASEAMVAGTALGFVRIDALAAWPADRPISVAVGGVAETVVSPPLPAGTTRTWAWFRMSGHGQGQLDVRVTLGDAVAQATVTSLLGSQLLLVVPPLASRGATFIAQVSPYPVYDPWVVTVHSIEDGELLGRKQLFGNEQTPISFPLTISTGARPGPHRLVAIARNSTGGPVGVSAFAELQVT